MDLYDDGFRLHEMIDSDIRSGRPEDGFDIVYSHDDDMHMRPLTPGLGIDGIESALDSEISNDGTGWFRNAHQMFNINDIDSIGGLLVNPQTALPVSMSESMLTLQTSVPSSVSDSSVVTSNSDLEETSSLATSTSITVTLPIQVITTSQVISSSLSEMAEMPSHVNLTVDVPTPSPSSHNLASQTQQILSVHDSDMNDNSDSPKPKSKNKTSKSNQQMSNENAYPKPAYSYSCLIAMALKNSKTGSLPVNEIYDFMTENFPYFKTAPNGWKNSVRHNLSLNKCFEKIEKPTGNSAQRKGYLWAMNPAKVEKMEEELQKWGSKDPAAIRKSMANPERLELIEKGELKHTDSEGEMESMSVSQVEPEVKDIKVEKDTEVKIQINNIGNDLLNNDFPSLSDSVNIDSCLPELDLQKGIWENLCEDRLPFLNDSPMISMSPKNPENMDDDSSLEAAPSCQRSYIQTNYIYKCAQRASSSGSSSNRLISHSSLTPGTEKGTICDA